MRQTCAFLGIVVLLITLPLAMGQKREADEYPKSSIFRWDEKGDVRHWLTKNKAALGRGDGCTLSSYWIDEHTKARGSVWSIASFVTIPEDEQFTAVIHDSPSNSGSDVRVGVKYVRDETNTIPTQIHIALAFSGSQDVFSEGNRSEARTIRGSNWKSLTVVKETVVGHTRFTFDLHCENGRTFLDYWKRLPPKRHASE